MNLIPMIAKELGVEVGEAFKVTRYDNVVFRFDETSLQFYSHLTNEWRETSDEFYKTIMKGDTEVERLPFKPKEGEHYWRIFTHKDEDMTIVRDTWSDWTLDYMCTYCGNCFRTKAEAEAHKYEIYEKLTGRKWEEK